MRYEHKELIHDYLNIDRRIKRIEHRMHNAQLEFEALNYYGGTDFYDPIGIKNKGFRVESRVGAYVDYIQACERNIQKNERKRYYFNRYTDKLDPHTFLSLRRRYKVARNFDDVQVSGHDEQVIDEILEIEEAISHEFETPMYINVDTEFSVDYMQMKRNEKSAQAIDAVAELLGVV